MKLSVRVGVGLAAFSLTAVGIAAMKAERRAAVPKLSVVRADPQVRRVAAANTAFGFCLLGRLAQDKPAGNVFFSSYSISNALTMALNGAGGRTQQDMAATLGLQGMPLGDINHGNGLLLPSLEHPDSQVQLNVANALWARRGVTFRADFQARCRRYYQADATTLDFASPSAADTINGWVSQNTQAKITQIVSADDIGDATAVLTNAVYFHGKWATPFDKSETQPGPFRLANGKSKTLPLMRQNGNYSYLETKQFQVVSLPYGQGRMSLYVLLPRDGTSLNILLKTLNTSVWNRDLARMQPTDLTVILPRFKADDHVRLKGPLTALGMGSAFEDGADFGPMGLPGNCISQVIHKAVLDVDEQGTVAAAATAVVMMESAVPMPAPRPVVRVDHPFFCVIRDNATGTLLFEGAIRDPQ